MYSLGHKKKTGPDMRIQTSQDSSEASGTSQVSTKQTVRRFYPNRQPTGYDSPLLSPPARLRVHQRKVLESKVAALTSDVTCLQWQSPVLQT